MINKAREFAVKAHTGTNHLYDEYLPYEYHLRHVVRIANKFMNCLCNQAGTVDQALYSQIVAACWLHDTIEDCRVTYSEIVNALVFNASDYSSAKSVAEIVRAVTNDQRGRNRQERMSGECYRDIISVPGALFVKLCDRIANVEYSIMTDSSKLDMYKKEYPVFSGKLRYPYPSNMEPIWEYLESLLSGKDTITLYSK